MKAGGRYFLVDGKRVPEAEYLAAQAKQSKRAESDSGKASTKQQRGNKR